MKRNSFLKLSLAVGGLTLTPFKISANPTASKRVKKGINVASGKDRLDKPLSVFDGDTFYCKVSTADTDGDLYIFDSTRLKEGGPPLHYHFSQDEWWYIISGEFLFKVGEEMYKAKAGDSVFGPRGIPHTFAKVGAILTLTFIPGFTAEARVSATRTGKLTMPPLSMPVGATKLTRPGSLRPPSASTARIAGAPRRTAAMSNSLRSTLTAR